ncbi:hypothetical protein NDU88_001335 [Pleurodeles waltl]|uniref:Uncharacterized protein n=1 Tax=Pleurodeles waltl TaxID=8319 RepID=A0AAV7L966_PLEWA|nr:hypothetical protein NDU88_001335 [Pleurodeles waltl]
MRRDDEGRGKELTGGIGHQGGVERRRRQGEERTRRQAGRRGNRGAVGERHQRTGGEPDRTAGRRRPPRTRRKHGRGVGGEQTVILMSNGNGKIVICSFVREEDNVVLPRPRDSLLTSRARESELETLGVERTVEAVAATSQRSMF